MHADLLSDARSPDTADDADDEAILDAAVTDDAPAEDDAAARAASGRTDLDRSIEALLFVAGEALSIKDFARLTGASQVAVAEALARIEAAFADRGLVLREVAGGYRFASAPAARDVVEAYLLPPKTNLSPAALETVAIIAYLQPVTKAEIEGIRGVSVDSVVATLVDRRFIAEAGRKDVVGRPMLYKTTPEFLEAFGLRSLTELPPIDVENVASGAQAAAVLEAMARPASGAEDGAPSRAGTDGAVVEATSEPAAAEAELGFRTVSLPAPAGAIEAEPQPHGAEPVSEAADLASVLVAEAAETALEVAAALVVEAVESAIESAGRPMDEVPSAEQVSREGAAGESPGADEQAIPAGEELRRRGDKREPDHAAAIDATTGRPARRRIAALPRLQGE